MDPESRYCPEVIELMALYTHVHNSLRWELREKMLKFGMGYPVLRRYADTKGLLYVASGTVQNCGLGGLISLRVRRQAPLHPDQQPWLEYEVYDTIRLHAVVDPMEDPENQTFEGTNKRTGIRGKIPGKAFITIGLYEMCDCDEESCCCEYEDFHQSVVSPAHPFYLMDPHAIS